MARATRIALDLALAASKFGHYHGSIAWAYFKVESAPPMTVAFLNGAGGRLIENVVGGAVRAVIGICEATIRSMDKMEAKAKLDKEAALLAAQELAKAEEEKKRQKESLAKLAKEEEAKAKKAEKEASDKKEKAAKKPDEKKTPEKKSSEKKGPTKSEKKK